MYEVFRRIVLSTIHSEIPRGVVLGDYVIEYGDDDSADEFEDFPGDEGNWWTSCILYHAFNNFRSSRNRRRTRVGDQSRVNRHLSSDTSNSDEGSVASVEYGEYRLDEIDDDFVSTIGHLRGGSGFRRWVVHFHPLFFLFFSVLTFLLIF